MIKGKSVIGKYIDSFDGTNIYYEISDQKSKTALIFLHGMGGNLEAWDKEVIHFSNQGITTVAIDLRGHGFSERSPKLNSYKMGNFAKDVRAIIQKEGITHSILVGHCFGGMVSILLAGSKPKVTDGLILIDTSYRPPVFLQNIKDNVFIRHVFKLIIQYVPGFKLEGYEDAEKFVGTDEYDIGRISQDLLHTSLKSYLLVCDHLMDYDATTLLHRINVPTLVINGTNDTIFPPQVAKELASRIKNSHLDLMRGMNHILVINNPLSLTRQIEKFLDYV
jgi:pimeloyl-ACP methyl ester carboxylesterase